MSMAEASALVRAFMGATVPLISLRWSKVVALGLLGLLFTGAAVLFALCYMWLPQIWSFWVALSIGAMVLAAISFLACIINICIME